MPAKNSKLSRLVVKSGQLYRSKARRGFAFVRIVRVFRDPLSVTARQVRKDGSPVKGRYPKDHVLAGVLRGAPFTIYLTYVGNEVQMPARYELVSQRVKKARGTLEKDV